MGLNKRRAGAKAPANFRTMTADELRQLGPKLFGFGWQTRMGEVLNVDTRTVRYWASGSVPIPGPAVAALRCFAREKGPA